MAIRAIEGYRSKEERGLSLKQGIGVGVSEKTLGRK